MAEITFNGIKFEGETFGRYLESLPHLRKNALLRSGALVGNSEMKRILTSYTGTAAGRIPIMGRISDADSLNYDGETDVTFDGINSLSFRFHSYGRMKGWEAKQFTKDITGGVSPLTWMGRQIADYWDDDFMKTLQCQITGIFSNTADSATNEFITKHTYDITGEVDDCMGADTLNSAIQQASGEHKGIYTTVIVPSKIATNLENMKLLQYMKGTDANAIQRDLTLATWNGRTVIVDDSLPYEVDDETGEITYTSYVLGRGAFIHESLGATHPVEHVRDAITAGGIDRLINRRRDLLHPYGFDFVGIPATNSPTNAEFATATNWKLVQNAATGEKVPHQKIPFVRIISKG